MALQDYIENETKEEKKYAQVELTKSEFQEFKTALDKDGLKVQQILKAAVKQYLAERKTKG